MKVIVYDIYGEKQVYNNVSVIFSSLTYDTHIVIKFKDESSVIRLDLNKLNYWEIINE